MLPFFKRPQSVRDAAEHSCDKEKPVSKVSLYVVNAWGKIGRKWSYVFIALIIILSDLINLNTIWTAFHSKSATKISISPIKDLKAVGKSEHSAENTSRPQSEMIDAYLKTFDSLRTNDPDKYDSIVRVRPGLLDSLQLLESIVK